MILESIFNLIYNLLDLILFFELPEFPDFIDNVFGSDGTLIHSIYKAKHFLFYLVDSTIWGYCITLLATVFGIYFIYKLSMFIYLNFIKL